MFTEDQINEALTEMKQPNVKSWELFSEINQFKVYRRPMANSALKEYKVLGTYPDLPSRYLVRAYTDYDFRKTWDSNMKEWKALQNDRLHFVAKFPWPLCPRDYVYELRVKEFKDEVIAVHFLSIRDESTPETAGIVRVDDFRQDVVIQPTQDGQGCNVWFGYFDNPKASGGVCVLILWLRVSLAKSVLTMGVRTSPLKCGMHNSYMLHRAISPLR